MGGKLLFFTLFMGLVGLRRPKHTFTIIEYFPMESKVTIICWKNETISLETLAANRNKTLNYTILDINYCPAVPFVPLLDALGMARNQKQKSLYLNDVKDLAAEHLTGIDEIGVETLSVDIYKQLSSTHSDVFCTTPKLKKLTMEVLDIPETIFDFSKLIELQELNLIIKFNTEGKESRM